MEIKQKRLAMTFTELAAVDTLSLGERAMAEYLTARQDFPIVMENHFGTEVGSGVYDVAGSVTNA